LAGLCLRGAKRMGCLKILVKGVLRGLGYLGYVSMVAEELGIKGWGKYVGDAAEIIAFGDDITLKEFIDRLTCHETLAIVNEVNVEKCSSDASVLHEAFYLIAG